MGHSLVLITSLPPNSSVAIVIYSYPAHALYGDQMDSPLGSSVRLRPRRILYVIVYRIQEKRPPSAERIVNLI